MGDLFTTEMRISANANKYFCHNYDFKQSLKTHLSTLEALIIILPERCDQINTLCDLVEMYEECLQQIANTDYRGNRSSESTKAFFCLEKTKVIKNKGIIIDEGHNDHSST